MNALVTLPVALPVLATGSCLVASRSWAVQRIIALVTVTTTSVLSTVLAVRVDADGTQAVAIGGWATPLGITYVADRTSSLLLAVAELTVLAVLVYTIGQTDRSASFHPAILALSAGVSASFLSGDLFHLFVAFEVMLTASYVLLTLGGRPEQVRTGMTYVVISLVASALFLLTVGLLYGAAGTVNLALLAERLPGLPTGLQAAFAVLLLGVFGIKAALFPLFSWLPDSYPAAPSPVTALFAGLLTKVAVYAIIRTQTLLFPPDVRPATLLLAVAGFTMVIGVLGAITQGDVKRLLSFHIVSQIGYMVMGLGFFTVAALAGTVLFVANQIVVKTTLFLTGGLIEHAAGSGRLKHIGGLAHRLPALAALWLLPALSLAGVPPFGGFVAKLALVEAGFGVEQWAVVGVSLAVSLLTLFSMMKVWAGAFWGEVEVDPTGEPHLVGRAGGPLAMVGATAFLTAVGLAFAVFAAPLFRLCERAAADLLDPTVYVQAVLG